MNEIKKRREMKKLTQEDLSRILNISLRHYQRIEDMQNEPRIRLGLRLCKILDLNPFKIYLEENNEKK